MVEVRQHFNGTENVNADQVGNSNLMAADMQASEVVQLHKPNVYYLGPLCVISLMTQTICDKKSIYVKRL